MRKVIGVLAVIVLAVAALALSFRGAPLAVGEIPELTPPVAAPPEDMTIAVLPTGTMASVAAMAYRGGGFRDEAVTNKEGMMSEVTASAGAELAAGGAELSADQAQSLFRDGFVRAASPRSPTLRLTPRRRAGRSS